MSIPEDKQPFPLLMNNFLNDPTCFLTCRFHMCYIMIACEYYEKSGFQMNLLSPSSFRSLWVPIEFFITSISLPWQFDCYYFIKYISGGKKYTPTMSKNNIKLPALQCSCVPDY